MSNLNIHKQYILNHPREAVFDIWVSPEGVVAPVTAVEVDPRKNGQFKLIVEDENPSQMIGKFIEFNRPSKLVYSWEWNQDGEISKVDVTFNSVIEGTEVIIEHTKFTKESSRETHDSGWDSYIQGVDQLLKNKA